MEAAYGPTVQPKPDPSGKYPFVGPHYAGEIPGYIYFPWDDKYHPDVHAVESFNQAHGGTPPLPGGEVRQGPDGHTYQLQNNQWHDISPHKPGMIEQAAPLAVAGGGLALGQTLGTSLGHGSLPSFGLGGAAQQGAQAGASQIPGAAATDVAGGFHTGLAPAGATDTAGFTSYGPASGTPSFGLDSGASAVPGAAAAPTGGSTLGTTAAGMFGPGGSTVAGQGTFGLTGASPALGAAGIAAGAATGYEQGKGLYDAAQGNRMGGLSQAALALPTFGLSLGYNYARDKLGFGNKHHWKDERNDLNDLKNKGTFIPQNLLDSMPNKAQGKHAGFVDSLAPDFVGANPSGGAWVNNKFAQSRNVADLQPTDIVNYATFAEHDPDWFNKPLDQRLQIAQQALDAKAVSEGHGQVKVDWNKFKPLPAENQGKPAESVSASGPGPMPKGPQGNTTLAPRDNMGTPGRRPKKR